MKDQEEFYYGIFQSAVGTLQTFVIALRRNGRMSLTRPAVGGESCRAGFFLRKIVQKRELSFSPRRNRYQYRQPTTMTPPKILPMVAGIRLLRIKVPIFKPSAAMPHADAAIIPAECRTCLQHSARSRRERMRRSEGIRREFCRKRGLRSCPSRQLRRP